MNAQYIVILNVLLGCTHFEQIIKQKYLCNITTDLHLEHFLDHCRRPLKVSVKPGKREPMGRRASLVASGMDTGEGVYIRPNTRRVSTPSKVTSLFCPTLIRRNNMPHGRPTTDPKGESIRIRINDDMRKRLEKKSFQTGQSISQIIRNLITENLS